MRKENRRYIIFTTTIAIIFLIGLYFYKTNTGTLVCSSTSYEDGIEYKLEYSATYKNRKVLKVKTIERITLDETDEDTLEEYRTTLKELYSDYNELDYYENNISIKDTTLNSVTTINYQKIDMEKLIEIDSSIKNIIDKNNNVSVTKLKNQFQSTGAICHYKN